MAAILAIALAACTGTGASTTPSTPAPASSQATTPNLSVGRTQTSWGEIWDALPSGFPAYPGARPAETGDGPASATFSTADGVEAVLAWMRTALEGAGYSTTTTTGPLEDGSRTIKSTASSVGCRVQTTVRPLGGETIIGILFGAACPFD